MVDVTDLDDAERVQAGASFNQGDGEPPQDDTNTNTDGSDTEDPYSLSF